MTLRRSATWWSLFTAPAFLIPVNALAGLFLLAALSYLTVKAR